jgi:CYTH domain-containing protein
MALEIERKFLLKSLPKIEPKDKIKIEQFYLKRDGIWERVRSWETSSGKKKWIHTIKTSISPGVNDEVEKNITEKEFKKFKQLCSEEGVESRSINKIRYIYDHKKGIYWEVDDFGNDYKLIVAEIEIPRIDYNIQFPDWISELILMEVTGLKQFSNRSLSIKIEK